MPHNRIDSQASKDFELPQPQPGSITDTVAAMTTNALLEADTAIGNALDGLNFTRGRDPRRTLFSHDWLDAQTRAQLNYRRVVRAELERRHADEECCAKDPILRLWRVFP